MLMFMLLFIAILHLCLLLLFSSDQLINIRCYFYHFWNEVNVESFQSQLRFTLHQFKNNSLDKKVGARWAAQTRKWKSSETCLIKVNPFHKFSNTWSWTVQLLSCNNFRLFFLYLSSMKHCPFRSRMKTIKDARISFRILSNYSAPIRKVPKRWWTAPTFDWLRECLKLHTKRRIHKEKHPNKCTQNETAWIAPMINDE